MIIHISVSQKIVTMFQQLFLLAGFNARETLSSCQYCLKLATGATKQTQRLVFSKANVIPPPPWALEERGKSFFRIICSPTA